MSTTLAKPAEMVDRKWYVIDAAGKPLGRVAAQAAVLLRGKNKTTFTPNVDCGDHVIVINCDEAVLTGKKLEESGFAVTQATISRDIRQLKLTKVPKENGGSRYAVLQNVPSEVGSRYARVLKDAYISVDLAKNILVIKTVSGMAMAAAAAFDEMNWNEIVGCIGGDDTILCVARDDDAALVAAERLKKMVDGMEETGEEF